MSLMKNQLYVHIKIKVWPNYVTCVLRVQHEITSK